MRHWSGRLVRGFFNLLWSFIARPLRLFLISLVTAFILFLQGLNLPEVVTEYDSDYGIELDGTVNSPSPLN